MNSYNSLLFSPRRGEYCVRHIFPTPLGGI